MSFSKYKKPIILGVLFFLPVTFLLFLYPSTHHYNPLEIVNENVVELDDFITEDGQKINLNDHITVLQFLGSHPDKQSIATLNLKEMIYDKFKGFKRFQIVSLVANGNQQQVSVLKKELYNYEFPEYWHFVYGDTNDIIKVFNSLKTELDLDAMQTTNHVFIIDKELNQRGRFDDREKYEIEKEAAVYGLDSYDCIEVAELKNKMSEDLRILFTEYRQKRKGNFDSTARRAQDINTDEKN